MNSGQPLEWIQATPHPRKVQVKSSTENVTKIF